MKKAINKTGNLNFKVFMIEPITKKPVCAKFPSMDTAYGWYNKGATERTRVLRKNRVMFGINGWVTNVRGVVIGMWRTD